MKRANWLILSSVLAAFAIAPIAYGGPIQTPLASAVTVTGSSGGAQSSQCGFISDTPSQVVVVSQPTPLRFKVVQGAGQPTLRISGPVNQCAMAEGSSGGTIEIPGVWQPGTYSVFVGDRAQGSYPYTLSISPE
ncbi:MAG: hypothetical protein KME15_12180 [Drouetiella hepatica Uher 2000/2452]|jgi:hypothetical protein|uniref:Alpha-mannosidase n=1 Tax=Drouetiella hepatica Uher 2000/2452 TaxID=904376 RepID=A0A951QBI7_9CYAN|nr:hypothetical protein [Drouetiella hepatica Uher 2000/2452]